MADATAYSSLAANLAADFTVLSADRRGRGLSPRQYSPDHDIARDVEDVDAILEATDASIVFGLSSGAVITLEAARTLARVKQAVLFEPPFYRDGIDRAGIARLGTELEQGDLPSALLDALLVARTAPAPLYRIPRPLARLIARAVISIDAWIRQSGPTFSSLLPGIRYDFHDVAQVDGDMKRFRDVSVPVLLINGTASPQFLLDATLDLVQLLPIATQVVLETLGHDGPWNNGSPDQIARAIREFLPRDLFGK
ncbi:alpha/beta-hydrolase [Microstroma glucosiphilum]|uniref:Alpha/beta-hydrolase n=1 Tax=Pseudomicrostroma glucosiphilum TaxID=1684307 RepID=A0A316U1U6_9BASI|nr:alpha/beta-hydrolase [Pseudomicrostroma glucosiphilum]PWN19346.1 alpha/beta-hydrolase [Pseudomicrostroma glucosiphilum]